MSRLQQRKDGRARQMSLAAVVLVWALTGAARGEAFGFESVREMAAGKGQGDGFAQATAKGR